ncbi:Sensor histidine kinase LiaS [Frondihabitans sp. 762G35]|uniref:sensor histidine kinase n=1 Tax=Frondihabitans sp. 762G35 TaxID=1446794 RepID=UPI000D21A955|nr:sensor histidine kinase [Frondihabitans sp. 762G35]ARC57383.1 Sensor histidine kinase LiaS [Frondihabitans sp. 762G35]
MRTLGWWHVAVVGAVVVLGLLLVAQGESTEALLGGLASMAVLLVSWLLLGPRAEASPAAATALLVSVSVSIGVATGFSPSLAVLQCVGYPLVWFFAGGTRKGLLGNVLLVTAVWFGFLASTGTDTRSVLESTITCGLSAALSLGLGLWFTRVYRRVDERQQLIDRLEATQAQVEALSREAGAVGERERLVREIHDTIAQDLTGLVLTAQLGRQELADGDVIAASERLAILEDTARQALLQTRSLVVSGAALGIEGQSLAESLRRLGERFRRETGLLVSVSADDVGSLDRDGQVVLMRCAQEALANVRKHAGAGAATVSLTTRGGEAVLVVEDDGSGFDARARTSGFGLTGMAERLALVDGRLTLTTNPGGGTVLEARLPVLQRST